MKIIALALRNFKCYQATTVIPLFPKESNFLGLIGENGVGKSAVLQGLDAFFTGNNWVRNKTGRSSESGCGVAPIVLCTVEELGSVPAEVRDMILRNSDSLKKNLITRNFSDIGTESDVIVASCILFKDGNVALFDGEKQVPDTGREGKELKELVLETFKYVYIGAEVDIDRALHLNSSVLNFIKGTGFVDDVADQLKNSKDANGVTISAQINKSILKFFDETFVRKLQEFDPTYGYKNTTTGASSNLTERQLADLVTQVVFNNRELTKIQAGRHIGLAEMSSGQRRAALLDYLLVVISTLSKEQKDKIILGIDEPEVSVGASSRIQQFGKLELISHEIGGVVFTTHWYGWIQQLKRGGVVLVKDDESGRTHSPFSVSETSKLNIPRPYEMRMMFDLLSSLGAWAENNQQIKFVVCEGLSDSIYISKHFESYKVLSPQGRRGNGEVLRLYNVFHDYVSRADELLLGNIVFLIDTDPDKAKDLPNGNLPNLKRLSRNSQGAIEIVTMQRNLSDKCEIEDLLSPSPFLKSLQGSVGELLDDESKTFINELQVKHADQTGIRAFGLDDIAKLRFKGIYSGIFKLRVAENYLPAPDERETFRSLLNIF